MAIDKVEQRIQKDPNDVHEVPVKAAHFHGGVIVFSKWPAPGCPREHCQNSNAHDDMDRVQASHEEVEDEEEFGIAIERAGESRPREKVMGEVFLVLDAFDEEKPEGKGNGDEEPAQLRPGSGYLGRVHCQSHGEAAGEEHGGVESAKEKVVVIAAPGKGIRIRMPVNG